MADVDNTSSDIPTPPSSILEVALIGGGPAGLIAAKQLVDISGFTLLKPRQSSSSSRRRSVSFVEGTRGSNGNIAIFEETGSVGGIWTRDPKRQRETVPCSCRDSETSESISVPASSQPVYEGLIANLPKDMTSFTDRPFPSDRRFFPTPDEMAAYYDDYANWHAFDKSIHFNSRVEKCWKVFDKEYGGDLWHIQVRRTTTKKENDDDKNKQEDDDKSSSVEVVVEVFQSKRILVCSGHHRKAFVPDIRGLRHCVVVGNNHNDVRHSSAFQTPKDYHDKSVLIVGGGISSNDIAGVLSKYGGCKRVTVSVRKWSSAHKIMFKTKRKKLSVVIRPGIDRINEDGSVLFKERSEEDGHDKNGGCDDSSFHTATPEPFDAIIFATGYRYWYPYLPNISSSSSSSSSVNYNYMAQDGYKMNRLYMRVLYIDDPSLAFVGVTNFNFSPAIMMEYQSKWYAAVVINNNKQQQQQQQQQRKLLLFNKAEMEREAATHDNDGTQDKLLFQFPSYCNSLVAQMNKSKQHKQLHVHHQRGYWTQLIVLRLWWHIKSLWARGHPSVYWALCVLVPTASLVMRWIAQHVVEYYGVDRVQ
jgi:cation diffusion facilitator CzcD-associated flavoprotein CzcO